MTQCHGYGWPEGYTPVFEGLHRDLRIVVDYGKRQELVLLALVNNETGEEMEPEQLLHHAARNGFNVPEQIDMTLDRAVEETRQEYRDGLGADEGYVLTWYRPGTTPFRLKLKFIEYLRLHRLVCGVSPKRIWEAMANENVVDLREWLDARNQTPWFEKFVNRWVKALQAAFDEKKSKADALYESAKADVKEQYTLGKLEFCEIRKAFAAIVTKQPDLASICFAKFDGKNVNPVIWKQVKYLTRNSAPLRDAQFT